MAVDLVSTLEAATAVHAALVAAGATCTAITTRIVNGHDVHTFTTDRHPGSALESACAAAGVSMFSVSAPTTRI